MPVLDRIAYFQNRRDEAPNVELAQALAARRDKAGIREIAQNLWHAERRVQHDCLKVLYEVGALKPELIAGYAPEFLKLLKSKSNRAVWGSMTALAAIAHLKADLLYQHFDELKRAIESGSVITIDNGLAALATVAAQDARYQSRVFPFLLSRLERCRPKDVPQYAEKIARAVTPQNRQKFVSVLETRMSDMTGSRAIRLKRVLRRLG